MTFVTFHASLNSETENSFQESGIHLRSMDIYERQINWLFRSAEHFYPACRMVVITDLETGFDNVIHERLQGRIEIFRAQAPGSGAMLSRAQAQVEWLEHEETNGASQNDPVLLLDSDMLINGRMEELRAAHYDVALTYRSHRKMPINGGAFIIGPGKRLPALVFSRWVEGIYKERFADDLWYGHQMALIEAAGRREFEQSKKTSLTAMRPASAPADDAPVHLSLLSVDEWNRTVDVELLSLAGIRRARILHFKGPRKKLMEAYFNGFLAPRPTVGSQMGFYLYGMGYTTRKKLARRVRRIWNRLDRSKSKMKGTSQDS